MDRQTINRVNDFLNRVTLLTRGGREGGGRHPHKFFLLLAIADMIAEGLTNENEIPVNDTLKRLFEDYWNTYEPHTKVGDIAMPLRRLSRDGIWELADPNLQEREVSFARIKRDSPHGKLAKDWYDFFCNPACRQAFKENLTRYYFTFNYQQYAYLDPEEDPNLNRKAKSIIKGEPIEPGEIYERNMVFRDLIRKYYDFTCCVSGTRILANQYPLLEAAHIKDFAISHNDALSNGIALNPLMHKAFDMGLFTIDKEKDEYRVKVAGHIDENTNAKIRLNELHNQKLYKLPDWEPYRPDPEYLEWHRGNRFEKFLG